LVLGIDLSKVGCQGIAVRLIADDHTWKDDNWCADHDVEVYFVCSLLNLAGLIRSCLTCSVEDSLHLAELHGELHDLSERFREKVDFDGPSLQNDRGVIPWIGFRFSVKGLVTEVS